VLLACAPPWKYNNVAMFDVLFSVCLIVTHSRSHWPRAF
jgi:hypothetical protein